MEAVIDLQASEADAVVTHKDGVGSTYGEDESPGDKDKVSRGWKWLCSNEGKMGKRQGMRKHH